MKAVSLGDLAQNLLLSRQNLQLKQDLNRLTQEFATGRVSDVADHLDGKFSGYADFERDLVLLEAYNRSAFEAANQAEAMQITLEAIRVSAGDLTETLGLSYTAAGINGLETVTQEARSNLEVIFSRLNTSIADRSLFSGANVSQEPLPDVDTLLTQLSTALAGATTATDVLTAADAFFAPSGTFETSIYQGGSDDLGSFDLGNGESVSLSLRADDEAFKDVLKAFSLSALVNDPVISLSAGETQELLQALTANTIASADHITDEQASLGFAQERIEAASVRISTEKTSIEIARNELIGADPFETATELEAVQIQLETLYTVTARSSRLSLVNFLS